MGISNIIRGPLGLLVVLTAVFSVSRASYPTSASCSDSTASCYSSTCGGCTDPLNPGCVWVSNGQAYNDLSNGGECVPACENGMVARWNYEFLSVYTANGLATFGNQTDMHSSSHCYHANEAECGISCEGWVDNYVEGTTWVFDDDDVLGFEPNGRGRLTRQAYEVSFPETGEDTLVISTSQIGFQQDQNFVAHTYSNATAKDMFPDMVERVETFLVWEYSFHYLATGTPEDEPLSIHSFGVSRPAEEQEYVGGTFSVLHSGCSNFLQNSEVVTQALPQNLTGNALTEDEVSVFRTTASDPGFLVENETDSRRSMGGRSAGSSKSADGEMTESHDGAERRVTTGPSYRGSSGGPWTLSCDAPVDKNDHHNELSCYLHYRHNAPVPVETGVGLVMSCSVHGEYDRYNLFETDLGGCVIDPEITVHAQDGTDSTATAVLSPWYPYMDYDGSFDRDGDEFLQFLKVPAGVREFTVAYTMFAAANDDPITPVNKTDANVPPLERLEDPTCTAEPRTEIQFFGGHCICPEGMYESATDVCTACPVGTYTHHTFAFHPIGCITCPSGYSTASTGSTTASDCDPCGAGKPLSCTHAFSDVSPEDTTETIDSASPSSGNPKYAHLFVAALLLSIAFL